MSDFRAMATRKPPHKGQQRDLRKGMAALAFPPSQRSPRGLSFLPFWVGRKGLLLLTKVRMTQAAEELQLLTPQPSSKAAARFEAGQTFQSAHGSLRAHAGPSPLPWSTARAWGSPGQHAEGSAGLRGPGQGRTCPHPPPHPDSRREQPPSPTRMGAPQGADRVRSAPLDRGCSHGEARPRGRPQRRAPGGGARGHRGLGQPRP